jgi:hypothetical protein
MMSRMNRYVDRARRTPNSAYARSGHRSHTEHTHTLHSHCSHTCIAIRRTAMSDSCMNAACTHTDHTKTSTCANARTNNDCTLKQTTTTHTCSMRGHSAKRCLRSIVGSLPTRVAHTSSTAASSRSAGDGDVGEREGVSDVRVRVADIIDCGAVGDADARLVVDVACDRGVTAASGTPIASAVAS